MKRNCPIPKKVIERFEAGYAWIKYQQISALKCWKKEMEKTIDSNKKNIEQCLTTREAYLFGQTVAYREIIETLEKQIEEKP